MIRRPHFWGTVPLLLLRHRDRARTATPKNRAAPAIEENSPINWLVSASQTSTFLCIGSS